MSSAEETSWDDVFDHSDQWSDHDLNSPMWWSQRSDFSSICTDDLSDMDTLSQLRLAAGDALRLKTRCYDAVFLSELNLTASDSTLVKEVYALIEKNKKPSRSSTRRMLVLLIAALCRCHPVQTAKILPRILSYTCLRLRDGHAKTTDACVILVSALALYAVPCPVVSLPGGQPGTSPRKHRGDSSTKVFEAIAAVFAREANAVGEAATRCLCGLLHPVDFDGVSVPGPSTILAHATRIHPFFKNLLWIADTVGKMDGSTMFATFSPLFLVLQSTCQLARDAHEKASFAQLGDYFAPYIASIYEAIEDAFQCGPRDDWMLRKRGMELLTMLLDIFALQDSSWCATVGVAKEYFQSQLERVRALVLAGRHDSVSLVREASIPAAMAFEHLEKLCPQAPSAGRPNTGARYDFVSPNHSFSGKRWANPTASNARDIHNSAVDDSRDELLPGLVADESAPSFGEYGAGDEALPSHETAADADDLVPVPTTTAHANIAHSFSANIPTRDTTAALGTALVSLSLSQECIQDDESFIDQLMDHAAPEDGDEAEHLSPEDDKNQNREQSAKVQREGSNLRRVALLAATSAAAQDNTPTRPLTSAAGAMQAVATLKQFAAKQRAQTRSRRTQHQDVPHISLPKRRTPQTISPSVADDEPQTIHNRTKIAADSMDNDDCNLELTRAEAALEAAQCGEYELAFRLCIVEDDLELLRRTMVTVETPCMATLSNVARNALCTAFLSLLDGDVHDNVEDSSDIWLALQWLQHWVADVRRDRRQFDQLDARVAQALLEKLREMATVASKSALAAAHVLFLLGE
ncbi:hypothetical protein PF002_g17781 [Phytophthora fragariae]|uniref:Uncharacterized protein n=2 Tax=Phytophthora TaxID=4783 RepID=A0A6A3Y952_9STRA|nr:hypothetical protein PF002_g17781 [Phytophthora fragariae]